MSTPVIIALTTLMAAIPATIWGVIFYKKDPVDKPRTALTFLAGILSVLPMLAYKWSWDHIPAANIFNYTNQFQADILNLLPHMYLPLGTILAFMFVGVVEEYLKHIVVVKADRGFFRNIDDAIEFSIIAALGFAFIENILYFYYIWQFQGTEVLLVSFVFRGIFSTFAHILFSGIYGYFYGLAYFADPIWAEEQRKDRHKLIKAFHKIAHFRSSRIYANEKLMEGLLAAVILHAGFNILLELGLTSFMVPFLLFGYGLLDYLFKKKENLKKYGCITGENSKHVHHKIWERFSLLSRKT